MSFRNASLDIHLLQFNRLLLYNLDKFSTKQTIPLKLYKAHAALNDVDAAVESFRKALELEPTDGTYFFFITNSSTCTKR